MIVHVVVVVVVYQANILEMSIEHGNFERLIGRNLVLLVEILYIQEVIFLNREYTFKKLTRLLWYAAFLEAKLLYESGGPSLTYSLTKPRV